MIDHSGQGRVFLQYRDTNFVNACHGTAMGIDKLRLSLLGAIRYGKPMVIDLMDVDILDHVKEQFEKIEKGLWEKIIKREIHKNSLYESLIREADGEQYKPQNFIEEMSENFVFMVLSSSHLPPDELLTQMYVLRIAGAPGGNEWDDY